MKVFAIYRIVYLRVFIIRSDASFEVRYIICCSDANIFSDTELSILWDRSVEYLHAFISRHMNTISNVEQLLQIKEELLILSELVSDDLFNLRPHGLYEIIRSMWSSFETLQVIYSMNLSNIGLV